MPWLSRTLARAVWAGAAVIATASALQCATPPPPPNAPPPPSSFYDDAHPLAFHSSRFELRVPLPDGHGWRIDDHRSDLLVATHAATASSLTLGTFTLPELTNRDRCEKAARARGLVPRDEALETVERTVTVGPGAYDTTVLVALEPGTSRSSLGGHVFLFGALIRRCLFAHYATRLGAGEGEDALSARLAIARVQILGGITVDAFDQPQREREAPPRP